MNVTIDTTNKTFEVCTEGDLISFNNLTIELLKTIERCKGIITIPNKTSTTGIPNPLDRNMNIPPYVYTNNNSTSVRSNF